VPRRSRKTDTVERTIGAKLVELRKRRAMKQVDLAAQLGMSQSLLSRYEKGRLRLHGALVTEMAKALHVSTDEILGFKDVANGHDFFADRRVVRRLQQIEKLPRRKKEILLATIDSFLRGESSRS
jgi:transcriptional regulator with XRE-family HTH domain